MTMKEKSEIKDLLVGLDLKTQMGKDALKEAVKFIKILDQKQ